MKGYGISLKYPSVTLLALVLVFGLGWSIGEARPADQGDQVEVLIGFEKMPGASEERLINKFGGEMIRGYNNFPIVFANLPEKAISALSDHPSVRYVDLNQKVYALDYDYYDEYGNPWGIKHINSKTVHDDGHTGDSVKVAIIDSGVDYEHPNLAPNFVEGDLGYDFVEDTENPMDVYGHGTHVAGTVAAAQDGFGVVGVAPNVQLISLRILNDDGVGDYQRTIAALDWILEYNINNENPIRITNNSYGRGSGGDSLGDAFRILSEAEVLHVAAAGNSGNPAGRNDSIIYPAKYESVMAIGAIDKNNDRANFSSTGPDLELVAPGVSVLSTWNNETAYTSVEPFSFEGEDDVYYKEGSGTSMASPHVAGVAALVWGANPDLTNEQVRTILQETAEDLRLSANHQGYGLVRADLAVREAVDSVTPDPYYEVEIAPDDKSKTGATSTDVTYEFTITNTGTENDTYNISADGDEWSATTSTSSVSIDAGKYTEITVTHSIPSDATDDASDTGTLKVSSDNATSTAIFTTAVETTGPDDPNESELSIDTFIVTNNSNRAWTRVTVKWEVSGMELDTVLLEMFYGDELKDSKPINVSGDSAGGTDELRTRDNADSVRLTVTDKDDSICDTKDIE